VKSEIGRLTIDGVDVVLMPESRALWERVGDSVILEGDSDFNLDGTTEPATLRQVLVPRQPRRRSGLSPGVSRETPLGKLVWASSSAGVHLHELGEAHLCGPGDAERCRPCFT